MRVFIGIPVDTRLGKEIESWRKTHLKNSLLRFIEKDNLHITLIPPWNEENLDSVAKKLEEIKEMVSPFTVQFDKVVFGPYARLKRLIWAEGKSTEEVNNLTRIISRVLKVELPRRDFLLHLTLARFKHKDFKNFPNESPSSLRSGYLLPSLRRERNPSEAKYSSLSSTILRSWYFAKGDKKLFEKVRWKTEVDSVVFYESKLLPEGAQYKIIQKFKLCYTKRNE